MDAAVRTITAEDTADDSETDDPGMEEDDVTWSILGSPQAWDAVLSGQLNLHTALRRNDLRYCPADAAGQVISQTRITMLADLLGLGAWARADATRRDRDAVAAP